MTPQEIRQKAFDVFDNLNTGQSIIIKDYAKNNPEAFVQYGKDYIDQGGGLEFSNDYSVVTKIQSWNELMTFLQAKRQEAA